MTRSTSEARELGPGGHGPHPGRWSVMRAGRWGLSGSSRIVVFARAGIEAFFEAAALVDGPRLRRVS